MSSSRSSYSYSSSSSSDRISSSSRRDSTISQSRPASRPKAVIIHHNTPTRDPKRTKDMDSGRWTWAYYAMQGLYDYWNDNGAGVMRLTLHEIPFETLLESAQIWEKWSLGLDIEIHIRNYRIRRESLTTAIKFHYHCYTPQNNRLSDASLDSYL